MSTQPTTSASTPSAVVGAMNAPQLEWTRNRATRRKLVSGSVMLSVITVGTLATAGLLDQANRRGAALAALVATGVLLLGWILLIGCLNASVRGTADPYVARLHGGHDERQRLLHADTYRRCYWPMLGVLSLATLAVVVLRPGVVPSLTIFLSAYVAAVMMPLWTLSWTMPEELVDG
ncbi:hypothetical protein [Gemmatimonas sp.]|uniref:hypothetical protein n=1 Tax=Gemmatimonas sp. TaxID=1962908 RepID=UPI0022C819E4|nr:hypothetical protein [Gemmatimonas sp.]MCZ8204987.1 hypothetical protein [Gemmatimonas sp.]